MEGGTNGLMSAQISNEEYKIGFNLDSAHALCEILDKLLGFPKPCIFTEKMS